MKKSILFLGAILLVGCSATNSNEQVNDTTTTIQTTTETTTTVAKNEVRVYEKENQEEDAKERVTLKAKSGMMETMIVEYIGAYPEDIKTENDQKMFKSTIEGLSKQEGNDLKEFIDLNELNGVSAELVFNEKEWAVALTYQFGELDLEGLSKADMLDDSVVDILKVSQNNISIDLIEREFTESGYILVNTDTNF